VAVGREGFTVRVLRAGTALPAGVGFIAVGGRLVTCAHVVNVALGRDMREPVKPGPDALMAVDFPLLGGDDTVPRYFRVVAWHPPPQAGTSGGDVAGLELAEGRLPTGASPARLLDPAVARDARVAVFGYPQGKQQPRPDGVWAVLRMIGGIGGGAVQLDAAGDAAFRAQPGFSGSPVVIADATGDAVIGIFSAAGAGGQARDSYAIPVPAIVQAWPQAGLATSGPADEDVTSPRSAPSGVPAFTPAIRDRYTSVLLDAGLSVPDQWSLPELQSLRRQVPGPPGAPSAAADLLEALCTALAAKPLFARVGGLDISVRKLRSVYRQAVERAPESGGAEAMLILAASAGIRARRLVQAGQGGRLSALSPLARFMLGVAAHRESRARVLTADDLPVGDPIQNDPALSALADWLVSSLGHQKADVTAYLEECASRTWALIELRADDLDPAVRAWPDQIIVDVIRKDGACTTDNIRVQPSSDDDVREALCEAIAALPDSVDCVDLLLPRRWLCSGVEHWQVVDLGGTYGSMSGHLGARLRWAMHSHYYRLHKRLKDQFCRVDWAADPEAIPATEVGDPDRFGDWLDAREGDGMKHPPFFICPDATTHDPLGRLLRQGHARVIWLNQEASSSQVVCELAIAASRDVPDSDRRDDLPRVLTDRLRKHRPVIIWSDPDGRDDFDLPAARRGGTLRGGTG
jgi:hypothetical protein